MALPKTDPSLPSNPAPVFGDVDAARGDHLRANNGEIWDNLEYLETKTSVASVSITTADVIITSPCPTIIILIGVLTGNRNLIIPTELSKTRVINNCTGAYKVTVKTASGTGIDSYPATGRNLICDGTNVILDDIAHPIGYFYAQYPDANSNDDATAFPTSKTPAVLFGGTWEEQWGTEAITFFTGPTGSDTEQTRTNGKQADQLQGFALNTKDLDSSASPVKSFSNDNVGPTSVYGSGGTQGSGLIASGFRADGYGTPRIGSTTKSRNRLFKVWKKTA